MLGECDFWRSAVSVSAACLVHRHIIHTLSPYDRRHIPSLHRRHRSRAELKLLSIAVASCHTGSLLEGLGLTLLFVAARD